MWFLYVTNVGLGVAASGDVFLRPSLSDSVIARPERSRRLARIRVTLAGFLPTDRYLRRSRTSFDILTSLKETGTILQGTCPPKRSRPYEGHGARIADCAILQMQIVFPVTHHGHRSSDTSPLNRHHRCSHSLASKYSITLEAFSSSRLRHAGSTQFTTSTRIGTYISPAHGNRSVRSPTSFWIELVSTRSENSDGNTVPSP